MEQGLRETAPRRIVNAELQSRLKANADLIALARPHLKLVSSSFRQACHAVCLADRDGIVLCSYGESGFIQSHGLAAGYDWSEQALGRNAVGTALAAAQPLEVVGREHVREFLHGLASSGAPIHGPDGTVIGVLAVCTDEPTSSHERLVLASYAASTIQEQFPPWMHLHADILEKTRNAVRGLEQGKGLVGLAVLDRNLCYVSINQHLAGINGKTIAEHLGRHINEIIPQYAARIGALCRQVIEDGEALCDLEFRGPAPVEVSGDHWWIVHLLPLKNPDGGVENVQVVLLDITQQKQAEEEVHRINQELAWRVTTRSRQLEASNESLQMALQAARMATWNWEVQEDRITCSDEMGPLLGLAPKCHPSTLRGMMELVHPEDRNAVQSAIEQALGEGGSFQIESRVVWPDGSTHWRLGRGKVFRDAEARPVRLTAVSIDIDERRRAEELARQSQLLLEKTFAALDQAVFVIDPATRTILAANRAVERVFGHRVEDVVGRSTDFLHVDQERFAEFGRMLFPALDKLGVYQSEYLMCRRNGEVFDTEITSTEIRSEIGQRTAVVSVVRDISEPKRVGRALSESHAQLQALSHRLVAIQEEERRNLARELHDEVGQVLTSVRYLLETSKERGSHGWEEKITDAATAISLLVDRIRYIAFDLRPALLDQLGLLPALVSLFERFQQQTGIVVRFRHRGLEERLPAGHELAAFRIIQESLTNVARHAGVNQAEVHVWTDSQNLSLQIGDRGVGFDSGLYTSGSTCGLTGMRERVALLGGELTIETGPGEGTYVTAFLPLRAREESANGHLDRPCG